MTLKWLSCQADPLVGTPPCSLPTATKKCKLFKFFRAHLLIDCGWEPLQANIISIELLGLPFIVGSVYFEVFTLLAAVAKGNRPNGQN